MSYKITLIPGDGIGPEVTEAMRLCVDSLGLDIVWEKALAGEPALTKKGTLLPEDTLASIKKNKIAIKGPIITPVGSGFRSVNVALRQTLDLFACVRPAVSIEGIASSRPGINITVIRENSEDLYAGIEFEKGSRHVRELIERINTLSSRTIRPDSALSIKPISLFGAERIARFAFERARHEEHKQVTCVHKANIMKATDGLFLHTFRDVAKDFAEIEANDIIVDNLAMQLVRHPEKFDILLLPNLYGDIISDLCAGLVGGLGIAPGANIGIDCAVFEPVHGSAPKYTGKNKVNPTATILSGVMMLRYLGEHEAARLLEKAVGAVIKEGKWVTYDLKPDRNDPEAVGTRQMAEAIVAHIKELQDS